MKKLLLSIALGVTGAAAANPTHNIYAEAAATNAYAECRLTMKAALLLKMSCQGDQEYGVALARAVQQYSPHEVGQSIGGGKTFKSPGYRQALASPFELIVALHPLSGTSIERGLQATGPGELARLRLQVQDLQKQLLIARSGGARPNTVERHLSDVRNTAPATRAQPGQSRAASQAGHDDVATSGRPIGPASQARMHAGSGLVRVSRGIATTQGTAPAATTTAQIVAPIVEQRAVALRGDAAQLHEGGGEPTAVTVNGGGIGDGRPNAPRVYVAALDAQSRHHMRDKKYREFEVVTHRGDSAVVFGTFAGNAKTYSALDRSGINYAILTPTSIKTMYSR